MTLTTLQLQVSPKVEGLWVHIRMDAPPVIDDANNVDGDSDERATNKEGYTAFGYLPPGQAYLLIRGANHGFTDQFLAPITMPHDDLVAVNLTRAPLPRLRVEGRHFVTDHGRVDIVGADSFLAYQRFLLGQVDDVRTVFAELASKGFNAIRVFGMAKYISEQIGLPIFKPQDFGDDFYSKLPDFCALAADYGLYIYFVVFADTGWIMPEGHDQQTHFGKVIDALKLSPNTFGSLGNELQQHENFVDKSTVPRPSGIAFSSGSEGMDQVTSAPWWDFDELHPRRDYREKSIKDCNVVDHPNYVNHGLAVMVDEPNRFGSGGEDNVEWCALQAGAACENALGIVFHSKNGIYCLPFDDVTARHADAFTRALKVHP